MVNIHIEKIVESKVVDGGVFYRDRLVGDETIQVPEEPEEIKEIFDELWEFEAADLNLIKGDFA